MTSTWVEVMEGAVILRNGQGEVGLTPGERGRIALGAMPVKMPWPHDPLEDGQLALDGQVASRDRATARPR